MLVLTKTRNKPLAGFEPVSRGAEQFRDLLEFSFNTDAVQRVRVRLGKIVAWLLSIGYVLDMGDHGFRQDLVDNAITVVRLKIAEQVTGLSQSKPGTLIEEYADGGDWKKLKD